MPSFKPSTLVIGLVSAELLEIVELKGLAHRKPQQVVSRAPVDVILWRLLIGRHMSCAVRSDESIGRGFGAF